MKLRLLLVGPTKKRETKLLFVRMHVHWIELPRVRQTSQGCEY